MTSPALQATSLAPSLTASDLPRSIQFYTKGLGFEIVEKNEADGAVRFVMMKAGAGMLGVGQDDFAKGRNRTKGVGFRIWITTSQDVSALAERAKNAGITLDEGPKALPWGPMAFAVTDPDGFKLTIANPR
jgi:catechol 2,3-dioxygenase-like lactoylglutathione lyase family enzyme